MKRIISILLVLLMAIVPLSITASAAGQTRATAFTDVSESAWYYDAVKFVYENDMFSGTGNGKFSPGTTMTRAMFVTVLNNMSNTKNETSDIQHFADVNPDAWYFQPVEWAAKYSVVAGTGDYKFSPGVNITREQMATMLYRYGLATGNMGDPGAGASFDKYKDSDEVSDYAIKAMVWAIENKIIIGRSSDTLAPKATATRAEAAQMFKNAAKLFKNKDIVVPEIDLPVPSEIDKTMALMSTDEKIGQLFLARYPGESTSESQINNYHPGGYVFFEKDFKSKTKSQVQNMTSEVQNDTKIPMFTAVDEEGGNVVRVSSNRNLASERFQSLRSVYAQGGLDAIKHDTERKNKMLGELGLNLNLAPICDITTEKSAYMYPRSLGEDADTTGNVISSIVDTMNDDGISCSLKHFPGYGNNTDTHITGSTDNRTLDSLRENDFVPFQMGIEAGAPSVMVSHNTVTAIDSKSPASLSKKIHETLRDKLDFEGVIMTDDLSMGAITDYVNDKPAAVLAFQAGNDMIITSNLKNDFTAIKNAVKSQVISMDDINESVRRILEWKQQKDLL